MVPDRPDDAARACSEADTAFLEYVTRLDAGERLDFEAFCARHPHLAEQLRERHDAHMRSGGDDATTVAETAGPGSGRRDPDQRTASLQAEGARGVESSASVLQRLLGRRTPYDRYTVDGEIGRGGMGAILRVRDEDLRRDLAMKVSLADGGRTARARPSPGETRRLARFLEEAQITGQLQHPGIVPVHEMGLDPQGRVYFTMRLVKGQDLRTIFAMARNEAGGWTQTRALGVILRVCEAMAYAHDKQVVHRDLKPANIMVGRFGETYVMDWGLARIVGGPGRTDVRARDVDDSGTAISSDRDDLRSTDGPVQPVMVTREGDVIGTPAYMPPEQARGDVDLVRRRSDVYSVGAIIYDLLTGQAPFVPPDERRSHREILEAVRAGPPAPVHELNPALPPELVAICERAMARSIDERYESMEALGDDLRAYLERRVVKAYRTGAVAELTKWVDRNRSTAGALAVLLVVLIGAALGLAGLERARSNEALRSLDERSAVLFALEADRLWPIHPDRAGDMERWLADANDLLDRSAVYERDLERLQEDAAWTPIEDRALRKEIDDARYLIVGLGMALDDAWAALLGRAPLTPAMWHHAHLTIDIATDELPSLEERRLDAERRLAARRRWTLPDLERQRQHDRLARHVDRLAQLRERVTEVERRLELSNRLGPESIDDHQAVWAAAIDAIADTSVAPRYAGLRLQPQLGLVPIGPDPGSGLWEFWHVLSGVEPARGDDGRLDIRPETGLVLVLIPGGDFTMGAQAGDPDAAHFDPAAGDAEGPVHVRRLAAYLISKYEMTQAQWARATGRLPSENLPGFMPKRSPRISRVHPVENVSWEECSDVLSRWSLELPTEAQWERAARGDTAWPYWSGTDATSIESSVNYLDQAALALATTERHLLSAEDLRTRRDDGHSNHAPVSSFAPNPFGLHHVLGNVREWTLDWYEQTYSVADDAIDARSGEVTPVYSNARTCRGGSFEGPLVELRVSKRFKLSPNARNEDIGVRPSRALDAP